jgi:hypothetical protein
MTVKASKLAIAIAVIGSFALATAAETFAQAPSTPRQYWNYAPNSGISPDQNSLDTLCAGHDWVGKGACAF